MSVAAVKAAALRREASRLPTGSLAGRYHGPHRAFDLAWDEAEQGYRRRFEPQHSRTIWDEARSYSGAEVLTLLADSLWRRLTVPG